MGDPVSIALIVASTAFTAFSGMEQASAQKSASAAQQQIADMQAQNAQTVANRNALITTDNANADAAAQRVQAGQEQASAEGKAIEQDRQTKLMQSAAIAQAGGTGGDALDPTVLDIMGTIGQRGAYNEKSALYEGDANANLLNNQATLTQFQGKQQADMIKYGGDTQANLDRYQGDVANYEGAIQSQATQLKSYGSIFEGGTSIASKYAPPKSTYTDGSRADDGTMINWNY